MGSSYAIISIAEPEGLGHCSRQAVASLKGLDLDAELRFSLDVLLDERGHAVEQVARVARRLDKLMRAERHRGAVGVLRSIPGVGPVTAMTFRTKLPAPDRFRDSGQVARMVGLTPHVHRSGGSRRGGRLLKSDDARLRTVLVEEGWTGDEAAKTNYRRLAASTGSGKKAIVGMARRLAILLWRMSVGGEPYRAAA